MVTEFESKTFAIADTEEASMHGIAQAQQLNTFSQSKASKDSPDSTTWQDRPGNLTTEDPQTLKRLNEIEKSTGLKQEQKPAEASQLLDSAAQLQNVSQVTKEGWGGEVGEA